MYGPRRNERGWTRLRLGEAATEIARRLHPNDLPIDYEIDDKTVNSVERSRNTFKTDDPKEPLPYILKALGISGEVVLRAVGL